VTPLGTATLGGSSTIAIRFEGSQQVTSGTFVFTSSAGAAFGPSLEAIGLATVTFGKDVVVRGGTGFIGQQSFSGQGTLHLINHGRISADAIDGVIWQHHVLVQCQHH